VEPFVYFLTGALIFIGVAGVVVPLLPGTTLIMAGMILQKLLLPTSISWTALSGIAVVWMISILVDFAGVIIGTRLGGGTRWGMAGAGVGALVGLWFSLPALILGTVFGAVAAEKFIAQTPDRDALRAGVGAAVGFVLSTVARLICAAVMIVLFLVLTNWQIAT